MSLRAARWLAALLLLSGASAQAGLRLQLDASGLSSAERQASQALLDQASAALPPSFIQRLDRQVTVSWSDDLPRAAFGRTTRRDALVLNAGLLPRLVDPQQAAAPSGRTHGTLQRELLATVIHELTHLYDRAGLWPEDQRRLQWRCRQAREVSGPVGQRGQCRGQEARRFSLSDDPQLLDLAGWQQQVGKRGAREQDNGQVARSPDSYELSNPREFVAVNMEYFLLDPTYACRRPTLQRYLRQHFDW